MRSFDRDEKGGQAASRAKRLKPAGAVHRRGGELRLEDVREEKAGNAGDVTPPTCRPVIFEWVMVTR
jgi:hypothetical protein